MCRAWAVFFRDVLRAQGIDSNQILGILPGPPNNTQLKGALFVKNWVGPADGTAIPYPRIAFYPATKTYNLPTTIITPAGSGIFGQGSTTPPAYFNNHVVVEITVAGQALLFDPSYGKAYGGNPKTSEGRLLNLRAFQDGALDYVGLLAPNQLILRKTGASTPLLLSYLFSNTP